MIAAGKIALLRFPRTDLEAGKPRPVLVLAPLPGRFQDWLVCMISTQLHQAVEGFDEVVREGDADFELAGLRATSVIRIGRLAVVATDALPGAVGEISPERLGRIRSALSGWIGGRR